MTNSARTDQDMRINGNRMRPAGLLVAAGVLLTLSACTSNNSPSNDAKATNSPSASPSASKSVDPSEVMEAEAVKAYSGYWREMEHAYAAADVDGSKLKDYASGVALVKTQVETERMKKKGTSFTGGVTLTNSTITQLDTSKKLPKAKLSSCLDVTKWVVLDKDKKPMPMPTERLAKYVVTADMERWSDGWRVLTNNPQSGQPC
ncbi:hypothetical protein OG890_39195 [Streptomyces anulatus]|uniref:hypothetical protein n=1 Tax=Streptomyces anulatus TaxID=1892 RepID=UPI002257D3A5|nr:hypothetical protein [Streptomyces anulatus]MCX4489917.1 hypothetical protein [Streptomyces anulatus]